MTRATGGRGRAGLPQPYYEVLTARNSPPGKSPGRRDFLGARKLRGEPLGHRQGDARR